MARDVESRRLRGAAFLDRDGVLNVDHGYVCNPVTSSGSPEREKPSATSTTPGYLAVVVTNQSGIARGYYTEAEFRALHRWIDERLRESERTHRRHVLLPAFTRRCIAGVPKASPNAESPPGLLLQAVRELDIDPASSFLIGDEPETARRQPRLWSPSHLFTGSDLLDFVRGIVAAGATPGALSSGLKRNGSGVWRS